MPVERTTPKPSFLEPLLSGTLEYFGVKRMVEAPWIETYTGRRFNLDHPDFHEEDMAHSLSLQCRFTGHVKQFYSIAQHCCLVSDMCPPELAFEGLMHDAHEAYLTDVAAPWKVLLPEFKSVENALYVKMAQTYGIPETPSSKIKELDKMALMVEARQLMHDRGHNYLANVDHGEPADSWILFHGPLYVWDSSFAKEQWLHRFNQLKTAK